jgi:murein DD-endopeptidase MepM/ murein hydrolase activator NlpD
MWFKGNILTCSISFICGAASAAALWWYAIAFYYQPSLDDASVALLRDRLSELGPLSATQRKILADEMRRVRAYEKKLKQRAAELDSVINEAVEPDPGEESSASLEDISDEFPEDGFPAQFTAISSRFEAVTGSSSESAAKRRFFNPAYSETLEKLDTQRARLEQLPIGVPVVGRISSEYGHRHSPFRRHRRQSDFHYGIDFAGRYNSDVWATAKGVVVETGYMSGYGLTVVVDHGNGFKTLYGHLSKIKVSEGTEVSRGTIVGLLGSTGRSTGPHVHYEIRHKDRPINPIRLVDLVSLLRFV